MQVHGVHMWALDMDNPFVEDSHTLYLSCLTSYFISLFHFPPALSTSVY